MTDIERWTLNTVDGTPRADGTLRDDIASVTGPKVVGPVEVVPAEQLGEAVEALRELESWAARMPDAGFNSDDPRWAWWHEKPARYGGQS
jgi:hypothetical protein